SVLYFFFTASSTPNIYTLSLHDALPISPEEFAEIFEWMELENQEDAVTYLPKDYIVSVFNYLPTDTLATFVFTSQIDEIEMLLQDRKSTRLNSSHVSISYAVFCLKKKKK